MKSYWLCFLSLAMALSLAACGGGETAQQEPGGGCRRGNLQLLCRHQHCGGFRQPFAGSQV